VNALSHSLTRVQPQTGRSPVKGTASLVSPLNHPTQITCQHNSYIVIKKSMSKLVTSHQTLSHHQLNDICLGSPLRIITKISSTFSTNRHESSVEADQHKAWSLWSSSYATVLSSMQCDSSVSCIKCDACDG